MDWFNLETFTIIASLISAIGAVTLPVLIRLYPGARWLKAIYAIGRVILPYLTKKKGQADKKVSGL